MISFQVSAAKRNSLVRMEVHVETRVGGTSASVLPDGRGTIVNKVRQLYFFAK